MANLRVLHLIDSFHQGGTERQAVQLVRLLHETGRYDLHVACLNRDGVLRRDVERLGLGPIEEFRLRGFQHPTTIRQVRRFAKLLKQLRIDLLHTHDFYTNIFGMAGGLLAGVRVRIASRREMDPGRTKAQRFVERRAFDLAHAIVVNADAIRRDLTRHGVADGKIYTVYNGIDTARLAVPPAATREQALAVLGVPADRHRLFVSILANLRLAIKDHPTFLRAARRIKAEVPDAGFIIAGEGELVEPMRQLAGELGIGGDVFFTGACHHVPELLAASDVCVLSSVSEGFPNVIVEYMAAGRPVVSTNVGGASEAIVEGKTGYLVMPGDDVRMAQRIISLLLDSRTRTAMGQLGRRIALEKFSLATQLERTEKLYTAVVSRERARPAASLPSARPVRAGQAADAEAADIARRPAAYRPS